MEEEDINRCRYWSLQIICMISIKRANVNIRKLPTSLQNLIRSKKISSMEDAHTQNERLVQCSLLYPSIISGWNIMEPHVLCVVPPGSGMKLFREEDSFKLTYQQTSPFTWYNLKDSDRHHSHRRFVAEKSKMTKYFCQLLVSGEHATSTIEIHVFQYEDYRLFWELPLSYWMWYQTGTADPDHKQVLIAVCHLNIWLALKPVHYTDPELNFGIKQWLNLLLRIEAQQRLTWLLFAVATSSEATCTASV